MAVYRLLQNSAFGPEDVTRICIAYERALTLLDLEDNDPLTEEIAKLIIEEARTDVKDPEMICALALRELKLRSG